MPLKSKKKVILLTGSNGVLGRAIVKNFSNTAVQLLLFTRNKKTLYLPSNIKNARVIQCDFSNLTNIPKVIDKICQQHKVDVLINNAGINLSKDPLESSIEDVQKTFNVNFYAPIILIQRVLKNMIKNRILGKIINIASVI